MAAKTKRNRTVDFASTCVRIRPEVLFVKDIDVAEDLYQLVYSKFPMADPGSDPAPGAFEMTTADIVALGMFDGGLALVDNPWGDESSVEDAFAHWVESKEAAGEDWDESDFEYESIVDYEGPPIPSGCFIIGREAIRYCLHLASWQWVGLPDDLAADPSHEAATALVSGNESDAQDRANLIHTEIMKCSWDRLVSQLKNIIASTEK